MKNLKNLKFLDCYEVTQVERELIEKESLIYEKVTIVADEKSSNKNGSLIGETNFNSKLYTPLSNAQQNQENESSESQNQSIEINF